MTELVKDTKIEDDEEEFIDETLAERLWGLSEMFPDSVRSTCSTAANFSWNSTKVCFKFGRSALWILASSFTILILPVMFEKERASMHEQQLQQQRQILLGPNTAVSGSGSGQGVMGMMPPGLTPTVASSP
ncbi:mitochondrial import receptor subunit TOM22 homolog [Mercenaria mercenaria]|uniref:mitochondrial import receptor subunit TOM22 homolog n=1 Tax=Mercenaria mercenaria TaxID=6596 RepID=UPI001E1E18AA|nr:mitochondrial import receptor subunit TOM22 homolog [Mercenaria mercenaria]